MTPDAIAPPGLRKNAGFYRQECLRLNFINLRDMHNDFAAPAAMPVLPYINTLPSTEH